MHYHCFTILRTIGKTFANRYFISLRSWKNFFQNCPLIPHHPLTPHSTVPAPLIWFLPSVYPHFDFDLTTF